MSPFNFPDDGQAITKMLVGWLVEDMEAAEAESEALKRHREALARDAHNQRTERKARRFRPPPR